MPADNRPVIVVVDGGIAMTGALIAAKREAELLRATARFVLVIPEENSLPDTDFAEFERIARMPIVRPRKSVSGLAGYLPSLITSTRCLRRLLSGMECKRLQINDFYLMEGPLVRLLGYRGSIITWVRIDPAKFGLAGRAWLEVTKKTSTHIMAVSTFIRDRLPARLKARVIYDPAPSIVRAGLPDRPPRFAFVGNFIKGKGQDAAIAAFHKVAEDNSTAELHFYGGDMGVGRNRTWKDILQTRAKAGAGADRIKFHDFMPSAEAFMGAFAALNFSESESFSLVCQEASASGLPVIATRCGGPEEIIEDGHTGFLVPVGDVEAMAARMSDLLADPAQAAAMGEAGRRLVGKRFGIAQFRRQMLEIFDFV